ncbi:hypothetical protein FAI40_09230 [Acetobacteraceae bacterium]|nr:hypothetical protein FAI40_09230 [Acetobacteraceae bacterium]
MIFQNEKELESAGAVKLIARFIFPILFLTVLALLLSVPFRILGRPELQIAILLETVWFYTLYAPAWMGAGNIFIAGLCCEFFVSTPPGFIVFWMVVEGELIRILRRRLYESGVLFSWFLFSILFAVAALSLWGLCTLQDFSYLSLYPVLFLWLLSIGIYPLIYLFWQGILFSFGRQKKYS